MAALVEVATSKNYVLPRGDIASSAKYHRVVLESSPVTQVSQEFSSKVFGQEEACTALAQFIIRAEAGFNDPNRPRGVLIFLGPTGVGKTELSRALAEYLFPNDPDDHYLKINCTDLTGPGSVNRLKGTEPKWVGYGDPLLIMPDKLKDGAVVTFDEVEKAHPEVWMWMMPVMEEGIAVVSLPTGKPKKNGSAGEQVEPTELDFRNSYIIMTANEGAKKMQEARKGNSSVGFGYEVKGDGIDLQQIALDALRTGSFSAYPEFLRRIDDSIGFNELRPEVYDLIFDKFLNQANFHQGRANRGVVFVLATQELRDEIVRVAQEGNLGASNLRQSMHKMLISPAAEYKVAGAFKGATAVVGDIGEDGNTVFWIQEDRSSAQAVVQEPIALGKPRKSRARTHALQSGQEIVVASS